MLFREAELAREVLAHHVAVQERGGAAAELQELQHQGVGDGRLAGAGEAGEEHREALALARRMGLAQLGHDLGKGEPIRDLEAGPEAAPELGARDRQHGLTGLHLVGRQVLAAILDVDHLLERDHADAELGLEPAQHVLGVIRAVEVLAVAVLAGRGVVAADDEVAAAEVLADDGVPHRLARAGHAHGERQQAQRRGLLGIALDDQLVAAGAREVIDVAGHGHAHDRMDEQVGLGALSRPIGHLLVRPVHRVPGLEGDDPGPAPGVELAPEILWAIAQVHEIVMRRPLDAAHAAAQVDRVGAVQQVVDAGVGDVGGAVDFAGLALPVGRPLRLDRHGGDQHALLVAQGDGVADLDLAGERIPHVEGDGHRPQGAVDEPHIRHHAVVIGAVHEALERREAPIQEQLEVAKLALTEVPRGVVEGGLFGRQGFVRRQIAVLQGAAMGVDERRHLASLRFKISTPRSRRRNARPIAAYHPAPPGPRHEARLRRPSYRSRWGDW